MRIVVADTAATADAHTVAVGATVGVRRSVMRPGEVSITFDPNRVMSPDRPCPTEVQDRVKVVLADLGIAAEVDLDLSG